MAGRHCIVINLECLLFLLRDGHQRRWACPAREGRFRQGAGVPGGLGVAAGAEAGRALGVSPLRGSNGCRLRAFRFTLAGKTKGAPLAAVKTAKEDGIGESVRIDFQMSRQRLCFR